jgi:hypothetical protein
MPDQRPDRLRGGWAVEGVGAGLSVVARAGWLLTGGVGLT